MPCGDFLQIVPQKNVFIYLALILSMICGRIVWGVVSFFLYGLSGSAFTMGLFMTGAFINGIPGIVVQIIIIPPIVMALQRR